MTTEGGGEEEENGGARGERGGHVRDEAHTQTTELTAIHTHFRHLSHVCLTCTHMNVYIERKVHVT